MNTQKGSFREPFGSPDFCPPPPTRKTKGLTACNSQTASPFGCLNNFCVEFLSNFLGSIQTLCRGFFGIYLTYARYRNAVICARVQLLSGANRSLLTPFVTRFTTAHATASA